MQTSQGYAWGVSRDKAGHREIDAGNLIWQYLQEEEIR